jgi:hypothetical protein
MNSLSMLDETCGRPCLIPPFVVCSNRLIPSEAGNEGLDLLDGRVAMISTRGALPGLAWRAPATVIDTYDSRPLKARSEHGMKIGISRPTASR